jgi:tagatose 1,6-diphosphate aldolase
MMAEIKQELPAPPADLALAYGRVSLRFSKILPGDAAKGWAPGYHFRILNPDGTDVGRINFRVGDSEHVRLIAGHIGYEINEGYRGRGYALQACRAIAPFVRKFYASVIITSDPENIASVKTIEKLGAEFIDEVPIPPDDAHYLRGSRTKRRYSWRV